MSLDSNNSEPTSVPVCWKTIFRYLRRNALKLECRHLRRCSTSEGMGEDHSCTSERFFRICSTLAPASETLKCAISSISFSDSRSAARTFLTPFQNEENPHMANAKQMIMN